MGRFLQFDFMITASYITGLYLIGQVAIVWGAFEMIEPDSPQVQALQDEVDVLSEKSAQFPSLYLDDYKRAKTKLEQAKGATGDSNSLVNIIMLILGGSIAWRIACEFLIILFKIHESLETLPTRIGVTAGGAGDESMGAATAGKKDKWASLADDD